MAWVLNGDCSRLYGNEEGWEDADGTKHGGTEPKLAEKGWQELVLTAEPNDPTLIVTGSVNEMVNGVPTKVWLTAPNPVPLPTPAEEAAALVAIHNQPILAEIAALDAFLPRGVEDLIAVLAVDVTKLPQAQQDRLARKAVLRGELQK